MMSSEGRTPPSGGSGVVQRSEREEFLQEHLDLRDDAIRGLQNTLKRTEPIVGAAAELVRFIEHLGPGQEINLNQCMQWARLRDYIHLECGK